jgi:hypothetical protein
MSEHVTASWHPESLPREFYPVIGIIALIVQPFLDRTTLEQVKSVDVAGQDLGIRRSDTAP